MSGLVGHRGLLLASAAPVGPTYRWIRLYITANNGDAYTGLNELLLRSTSGGVDYPAPPTNVLTTPTGALTAATASDFYFANPPAYAFDQDYGSTQSWYNNGTPTPAWLKYDFGGSPVSIAEFGIIRAPGEAGVANRWPMDFELQGSNDNSSWTALRSVTGETGWGSGTYQARIYSVP